MTELEQLEMEKFREFITEKVYQTERKERAFSSWLFKFDNMKDHVY